MLEHVQSLAPEERAPLADGLDRHGGAAARVAGRGWAPETAPPAEPEAAPPPGAGGRVLDELARFFAENADVLEYFVPEAVEHLEAMAHSLLALERGADPDAEVATLFRAVHTLKGAAYTVGCPHHRRPRPPRRGSARAVREHRRRFTPATVEAVFASADAVRLMLAAATERPAGLESAATRARALVEAALALRGDDGGAGRWPGWTPPTPRRRARGGRCEPAVAAWSAAPSAPAPASASAWSGSTR